MLHNDNGLTESAGRDNDRPSESRCSMRTYITSQSAEYDFQSADRTILVRNTSHCPGEHFVP